MTDFLDERLWHGRRVFLTGHTGFKGSWLSLWLHRLGAQLFGYALPPPTHPNHFEAAQVRSLFTGHTEADVRDVPRLQAALNAADPEVIFHLAAQALVRTGYAQPRETFEINALGTANLLEAVRRRGRGCVVLIVTSDKCYENCEARREFRETDPLGGTDPYSASKAAAELVTAAYRRSFFAPERMREHRLKLASVRAGNVLGGGDWAPDRIAVDAITHLSKGTPIPVRNPEAIRPWQHVLDPLAGYLTLADRMLRSDEAALCSAWNFGPQHGAETSVRQLVQRFCAAWGGGTWVDQSDPRQPPEAGALRLNIDKAVTQLRWRPCWRLARAVEETVRWYRAYLVGEDMRTFGLSQIDAFESDAIGVPTETAHIRAPGR